MMTERWFEKESWIPEIHKMLIGLIRKSPTSSMDNEIWKVIDKLEDVMYEKHIDCNERLLDLERNTNYD